MDVTEEIIPMLSTGLLDKNGKEIFEGDIVRRVSRCNCGRETDFSLGVIAWSNDDGATFAWVENNDDEYSYNLWCYVAANNEVIGNIYENPELLNKK
jgi:uncharacterized phage protein (TIGR01671 family)